MVRRGRYHIDFGVSRLPSAMPAALDIVCQAQLVVDDLARRFDDTINLRTSRVSRQALGRGVT
jgi:hypothetical protein